MCDRLRGSRIPWGDEKEFFTNLTGGSIMGLRVATNIPSLAAQKTLSSNQRDMEKSFAQLSSGSRITKAADDAAGLSISETLKSTISNMLSRLRELGVQAASDTVGERERGFIDLEVQQLKNEVQRISETTRFGSVKLLDGSGDQYEFQVDINNDDFADRISFDAGAQNTQISELGIDGFDYASKDGAREALEMLEEAQVKVNGHRATLGAIQNRLISTTENLSSAVENFSAANSRIRDTDIAESSANLARTQVLQQASIGILAQANQSTASALKLVG
jgi:flagellin